MDEMKGYLPHPKAWVFLRLRDWEFPGEVAAIWIPFPGVIHRCNPTLCSGFIDCILLFDSFYKPLCLSLVAGVG